MTTEPQAIEVEVVEIDGVAPVAKSETRDEAPPRQQWQDWQQWQGQIRKLDGRWWPLWVVLGTIALLLLLTFGVVIGLVFVVFKMISAFLRAIFR
ncbi:hypothetical protein JIN84_19670 [Luteolibacter yonseiensis]|uniref:Uncharacterized protein n=1 Tax=Luteolibacter yonseiensis TaxID=1144680 RepID=A0A934RA79_9BACT|nr:hypothetical protein [Luteolibacter yonseiensis]MBK1817849.1 hypothetical protein [Luteolibacter yonseiensis]